MSNERDNWIRQGERLSCRLTHILRHCALPARDVEGFTDALDDHILEGLFMAFTAGCNQSPGEESDLVSAGLTHSQFLRQVLNEPLLPEVPDRIAGASSDTEGPVRARDLTGALV